MRLLVLTPEYQTWGGGIATFYRDFLPAANDCGIEIRVVEGSAFSSSALPSRQVAHGIVVEQLESARLSSWHERFAHLSSTPTFRRHLAAAWAVWEKALEGPEFDIVEATDWGLLGVPPVVSGTHPTVIQAHASCGQIAAYDILRGDDASTILMRLVELATLSAATEVQTYSATNARFWEVETTRSVTMIPPAWAPRDSSEPSTVAMEGLVVGRLQSWKGPDTLSEAMRLVDPRHNATVRWIGREVKWPSSGVPASVHLAKAYPDVWGTRIVHEQPLAPDDVRRRQATARFNIVPSAWDVFNFTTVEAMASRRPTIVSSGAGASDLIEHGRNGFIFPAGDAAGLAAAIEEMLSLSDTQQWEIGKNAYECVSATLDPHRNTRRRIERFEAAIALHSQGKRPLPKWTIEACSDLSEAPAGDEFLNNLPLRMLAKHLAQRALKRVLR